MNSEAKLLRETDFPSYTWEEIVFKESLPSRTSATFDSTKRSTHHCVLWVPRGTVVHLKDVSLQAEDCCTDIREVLILIQRIEGLRATAASCHWVLPHYAWRTDSPHQYQWLTEKCDGSLNILWDRQWDEGEVKRLAAHLLRALDFLHTQVKCVHGDIAPANIFFKGDASLVDIRLGDLDSIIAIGSPVRAFQGTYLYAPPEVLHGEYTIAAASADIWSVGVVVFQLLHPQRHHPFLDCVQGCFDYWALLSAVDCARGTEAAAVTKLPESAVTREAKSFISECMSWDAAIRPKASTLLELPWFSDLI